LVLATQEPGNVTGHITPQSIQRRARANATTSTLRAPALRSAVAAAETVAPVV